MSLGGFNDFSNKPPARTRHNSTRDSVGKSNYTPCYIKFTKIILVVITKDIPKNNSFVSMVNIHKYLSRI
jgi:hypothetical protein